MNARGVILQLIGVALATFFLTRLPEREFGQAQTILLAFAGIVLLVVALAVVLRPVRHALFRFYGVAYAEEGPAMAEAEDVRGLLPAVATALVALVAAGLAAFLR